MNYLAIARAVVTGYERNESDERSHGLSETESELLKDRIIASVAVEPAKFDRGEYERLWARWNGQDSAGSD